MVVKIPKIMILGCALSLLVAQTIEAQERLNAQEAADKHGIRQVIISLGGAVLEIKEKSLEESFDVFTIDDELLESDALDSKISLLKTTLTSVQTIEMVAFKMYSSQMISFYFIYAYEKGPVGFKIDIYSTEQLNIRNLSVHTKWNEIVKHSEKLTRYEGTIKIKRDQQ